VLLLQTNELRDDRAAYAALSSLSSDVARAVGVPYRYRESRVG
jgi:hypothetical protein